MEALKYWKKDGFDVATYRWNLAERKNQVFNGSGSDESGTNVYTYNEIGFRGDSIYKDGFKIVGSINQGISDYMEKHNFKTISDFRGKMNQSNITNPADFERVQFMKLYSKIG